MKQRNKTKERNPNSSQFGTIRLICSRVWSARTGPGPWLVRSSSGRRQRNPWRIYKSSATALWQWPLTVWTLFYPLSAPIKVPHYHNNPKALCMRTVDNSTKNAAVNETDTTQTRTRRNGTGQRKGGTLIHEILSHYLFTYSTLLCCTVLQCTLLSYQGPTLPFPKECLLSTLPPFLICTCVCLSVCSSTVAAICFVSHIVLCWVHHHMAIETEWQTCCSSVTSL